MNDHIISLNILLTIGEQSEDYINSSYTKLLQLFQLQRHINPLIFLDILYNVNSP